MKQQNKRAKKFGRTESTLFEQKHVGIVSCQYKQQQMDHQLSDADAF